MEKQLDTTDLGMIFGNALTNITKLYAAGKLEFVNPADWTDEIVSETTQLVRAAVDAQTALGKELGLQDRTFGGKKSGGSRPQGTSQPQASGGNSSQSGNDPDAFPYVPSNEGVTPGQVKFISSLLDERGYAIGDFLPLLNKESAKRAIYRMVNKGAEKEEEIFAGIL